MPPWAKALVPPSATAVHRNRTSATGVHRYLTSATGVQRNLQTEQRANKHLNLLSVARLASPVVDGSCGCVVNATNSQYHCAQADPKGYVVHAQAQEQAISSSAVQVYSFAMVPAPARNQHVFYSWWAKRIYHA